MARNRWHYVERLERRDLLAAFNIPWPEAEQLTLSFAPDGAQAGAATSALFQSLDSQFPHDQWQETVLKGFQTWAVQGNINIGLVGDGGQPFDTLGFKQGDLRFGDIRVGTLPMAGDVLAVANPYDPFVANSWVGDVFLNSAAKFNLGSQAAGGYDLFSVMLHESGHVFGIGHSTNPDSPMYPQFLRPHDRLIGEDVALLQSLYGARHGDEWEGTLGNETPATATRLALETLAREWEGDLTTLGDVDLYRLEVPTGATQLQVTLQAQGISLLTGRLSIVDAGGHTVASAETTDPRSNNLSLTLPAVQAGATYFVRVEAGRNDVFGIGAYQLHVALPGSGEPAFDDASLAETTTGNEPHPLATTPGYTEHTYYEVDDLLRASEAVKTYRVRSVDLGPELRNVMTIVVKSFTPATDLEVTARDSAGNFVPLTTIVAENGLLEVQADNVASGEDYIVELRRTAGTPRTAIDFEIEFDFDLDARQLTTVANQSLGSGQTEHLQTLTVPQSQNYHFVLASSDWSLAEETGVRMAIEDAAGRVVYATEVADGATRAADVFLPQGSYTLHFTRADGASNHPIVFQLSALDLSSPIGPQLRDTTFQPAAPDAAPTIAQLNFYWTLGTIPSAPAPATAAPVVATTSSGAAENVSTTATLSPGSSFATVVTGSDSSDAAAKQDEPPSAEPDADVPTPQNAEAASNQPAVASAESVEPSSEGAVSETTQPLAPVQSLRLASSSQQVVGERAGEGNPGTAAAPASEASLARSDVPTQATASILPTESVDYLFFLAGATAWALLQRRTGKRTRSSAAGAGSLPAVAGRSLSDDLLADQ